MKGCSFFGKNRNNLVSICSNDIGGCFEELYCFWFNFAFSLKELLLVHEKVRFLEKGQNSDDQNRLNNCEHEKGSSGSALGIRHWSAFGAASGLFVVRVQFLLNCLQFSQNCIRVTFRARELVLLWLRHWGKFEMRPKTV